MKLGSVKISQKILIPIGILLVLLVLIFTYLFTSLESNKNQVIQNIERTKSVIALTDELNFVDNRKEKELWEYRISKNPIQLQMALELDKQRDTLLEMITTKMMDPDSVTLYETYDTNYEKAFALRGEWLAAEAAGDAKKASTAFLKWDQQRSIVNSALQDIASYHTSLLDENVQLFNSIIGKMGFSYGIIILMTLAVFIVLYVYLRKYVIRPLVELTSAAEKVVTHNERLNINSDAQDEIGILYRSLNIMVDKLKESYSNMQNMALHDPLTGLPNRKSMEEYFKASKNIADRNNNPITIMFLDLDRFKSINDTLGHYTGDMILKEVARRFVDVVRKEDMVARLGGDEFMIMLTDAATEKDMSKVAIKLLRSLDAPMNLSGHTLHVATSIGIAVYPHDGQDIYTLLKNADIALYRAKELGRNRHQFYDYELNLESLHKLSLENDLRQALKNEQILYHYQPIVRRDGSILGAEALMRWQHPELGLLFPESFMGLAEETGLIVPLGEYGLQQACRHLEEWGKNSSAIVPKISLNFSSRHFAEFDLIERITEILAEEKCSPERIEIEITEGTAMNNTERSHSKFIELNKLGVSINIDDFGTGYSSLSYLKSFPVNRLKIDKSFVRYCTTDPQDYSIIKAIVTMSHTLNLEVVAEGVETKEQFDLLYELGCDNFQGFFIGEPMAVDVFTKWVEAYNAKSQKLTI